MRKVRVLLALLCGIAFFFGCEQHADLALSRGEQKAASHLTDKNYKIKERLGGQSRHGRHVLHREMLTQLPYSQAWALQHTSPDSRFGKIIVTYGFLVTNHPLEAKLSSIREEDYSGIQVNDILSEGQVIGGHSFPVWHQSALPKFRNAAPG